MRLGAVQHGENSAVVWQSRFGGLNRNLSAADGEIAAMENLSADRVPLVSVRPRRRKLRDFASCGGLGAGEALFWTEGEDFYYDGVRKGAVSAGEKRFYCLNRYIVIWPDKLFYNSATDEFGPLEASVSAAGVEFLSSPAPNGISSQANGMRVPGQDLGSLFKKGEAVTVSGCQAVPGNNKTLVIQAVEGEFLYFYDNSFPLPETRSYFVTEPLTAGRYYFPWPAHHDAYYGFDLEEELPYGTRLVVDPDTVYVTVYPLEGESYVLQTGRGAFDGTKLDMDVDYIGQRETAMVTLARTVPDMEHLCQCDNRLWGVGGDSIYASALGDPKVWNNFDGTAACSWSVQVGTPGAFTGAVAYGGYPLFFKEDYIYRVYGSKPSNYQLLGSQTLGCEKGSEKSFAVVGQSLYYKSPAGFAAYAGGVPRLIDAALGTARRSGAVAGSDGRKYYVSCREGEEWSLWVYDTLQGLWHREDGRRAEDFVRHDGELYMRSEDELWLVGRVRSDQGQEEETPETLLEFADSPGSMGEKLAPRRLHLRLQTEGDLTVWIQYDSSGRWEKAATVTGPKKGLQTVELVPRRCDHFRLRLCGRGDWLLWALGREYDSGSRR